VRSEGDEEGHCRRALRRKQRQRNRCDPTNKDRGRFVTITQSNIIQATNPRADPLSRGDTAIEILFFFFGFFHRHFFCFNFKRNRYRYRVRSGRYKQDWSTLQNHCRYGAVTVMMTVAVMMAMTVSALNTTDSLDGVHRVI